MKKVNNLQIRTVVFMLFFLLACTLSKAQTVLYSENCGTPTATTLIQNYTGWQNSNVTYSGDGTCDVRVSSASTGYGIASGGGNVMINDTAKWFMISGINTSTDTNLTLYCGLRKTTAENGANFVVEASEDGAQWTRLWLADSLPTGTGTSGWYRVSYHNVPSCNNLSVRFSNLANVEYRIDDIAIVVGEETVLETVQKPTFSPSGGTYYEPQTVTIASTTPNAAIYYTMDGTTPSTTSNLYQGPLTINNSVTVKAIAMCENMYDSDVATANYVVLDTNSLVVLPFDISTNSSNEHQDITQMPGFRGYYLGSSYSDGSVKFESSEAGKASLVAHLDSSPDQLAFALKGKKGGSNPSAYQGVTMEIAESSDGQQWQTVTTLSDNDISIEDFSDFNGFTLQPETRFVRWKLLTGDKGNTQLNNIVITKRAETPGDTTSIIDYNTHPFSVYPNPTTDYLNFDTGGMTLLSLHLMNLNGEELQHWNASANFNRISLASFPRGMYLLRIVTTEGVMLKKVVRY